MTNKPSILSQMKERDEGLYQKALTLQEEITPVLRRIVETFPHYTCHDDSHSDTVLTICGWLAGEELLKQLNGPELFVLFASIYLHDVGMVLSSAEREQIEASEDFREFERAHPKLSKIEALAEYLRQRHHQRSASIVRGDEGMSVATPISDRGLASAVALLCESHGNRDLTDFRRYDPFCAWGTAGDKIRLPLLGVLLRLSDLLHLTNDRTPLSVVSLLGLDNDSSRTEWKKHLSTHGVAPVRGERLVRLTCSCRDPGTHRALLRMCDYVNEEFQFCRQVLKLLRDRNLNCDIGFDEMKPSVHAQGYEPWLNLRFQLDREGILRLLQGARLYPGSGAAVQELVINAIDATRQSGKLRAPLRPIQVSFRTDSRELCVSDHGPGMDKEDIETFLLQLGRSLYQSAEYTDRYQPDERIQPLSQFGIGFAACFLAANHVVVETKKGRDKSILLDMYDLMGFVATRHGTRQVPGTQITLHLRTDAVEHVRSAVRALADRFPHVEAEIHVTCDGETSVVSSRPFRHAPRDLLSDFFKDREGNFTIEYRDFDPKRDSIEGSIGLLCQRVDGVLVPKPPEYYKFRDHEFGSHRLSQLGFALPFMQNRHNSLLKQMNFTELVFDLDLRGSMVLELDPSRTRIQNSPHNLSVIAKLDGHLVDFLLDIYRREWQHLSPPTLHALFLDFGRIWFNRVLGCFMTSRCVAPLIDLFFDHLPLKTRSRRYRDGVRTWNEIRALSAPVAFYHVYTFHTQTQVEDELDEILSLWPDGIVAEMDSSYQWAEHLMDYSKQEAIVISNRSQRVLPVVMPWMGDAESLHRRFFSELDSAFILPFIGGDKYAFVPSRALRRTGSSYSWVNRNHWKIRLMLDGSARLQSMGCDPVETKAFLQLLHRVIRLSIDSAYLEYLAQHQDKALGELQAAGVISSEEAKHARLTSDDFVQWPD